MTDGRYFENYFFNIPSSRNVKINQQDEVEICGFTLHFMSRISNIDNTFAQFCIFWITYFCFELIVDTTTNDSSMFYMLFHSFGLIKGVTNNYNFLL